EIGLTAIAEYPRHSRESLGVVYRGWLAIQAEAGRERRLETRLAFLAFQRFKQRGFFAANVGTVTMESVQFETEVGAEDIVTEKARFTRFAKSFFEAVVHFKDLAVNVVISDTDAHRVSRDRHAFDHNMRIEAQDVAIFECTGLAFVRVTDQILLARQTTRHKAPFQAGRKPCTTTTPQGRCLDFGDDVFRLHAGSKNLAQTLIAATFDVVFETPVFAIQVGDDLGLDMTPMKDHAACQVAVRRNLEALPKFLEYVEFRSVHDDSPIRLSSSSMASIFSGSMRTHMCSLLSSNTGESPQAPMHSPSFRVNRPSGVVSLKPMPSF